MTTTFYVNRSSGVREMLTITSNQSGVPYLFMTGKAKAQNIIMDKATALKHLQTSAADPNAEVYRVVGKRAVLVTAEMVPKEAPIVW